MFGVNMFTQFFSWKSPKCRVKGVMFWFALPHVESVPWKHWCVWWKRSFTSWYGKYFMIYKVSYIPAGAEFLLSTVPLQPTLIASQAGTSAQRRWRPRCLGMLLQTLHTLSRSKWLSDILQKGWRGLDNGRSMSQWISSLSKRDDKRRMLLAVSVHQVRCNFRWRLRDQ